MTWQPIDTAPDDGTLVLVACGQDIWISSRKKGKCVNGFPTGWNWAIPSVYHQPTHWMPLPKPPEPPE